MCGEKITGYTLHVGKYTYVKFLCLLNFQARTGRSATTTDQTIPRSAAGTVEAAALPNSVVLINSRTVAETDDASLGEIK
jgi:hypothetical protein